MLDKLYRYWRIFFIFARYREYAFRAISQKDFYETVEEECIHKIEEKKYEEDTRLYFKRMQGRQFALQNWKDVQMGLWDERIEAFYSEHEEMLKEN